MLYTNPPISNCLGKTPGCFVYQITVNSWNLFYPALLCSALRLAKNAYAPAPDAAGHVPEVASAPTAPLALLRALARAAGTGRAGVQHGVPKRRGEGLMCVMVVMAVQQVAASISSVTVLLCI